MFFRLLASLIGEQAVAALRNGETPVAPEKYPFVHYRNARPISSLMRNRLGEPEDIVRVVAFLLSAEAGWVNGQVIRANGAMVWK